MANKTLVYIKPPGLPDTYYVPVVAAAYNESANYAVGSYCTYNGQIYKCTTATYGSFDANDWAAVSIADDVASTAASIASLSAATGALSGLLTRAATSLVAAINSVLVGGLTAPDAYPARTGAYRVTGLFAGLPTGANNYGTLFIVDGGTYQLHIYFDAQNRLYIGRSNGVSSGVIVPPTSWNYYAATSTVASET